MQANMGTNELISLDSKALLNALRRFLQVINSRWQYIFLFGVAAGAGFELFKFRGVSYYSVYKKNQLKKQLGSFEAGLRDLDNLIANSPEFADIPSSSTSS
ncbi:hypothetical protein Tcan_13141 [Toxocara canis]|uniref:Uncharacterized protein n=1 Tax=Toxocara canis TaxID=6265 RepID=A0A0B2W5P6_TOXCA|nr:hypothetical protein Tcan_13141 [Toxocara canis]